MTMSAGVSAPTGMTATGVTATEMAATAEVPAATTKVAGLGSPVASAAKPSEAL